MEWRREADVGPIPGGCNRLPELPKSATFFGGGSVGVEYYNTIRIYSENPWK